MIIRFERIALIRCIFFLLNALLFSSSVLAKKDSPTISKYKFEDSPNSPPYYFDDSDNVLLIDIAGNVLISKDLGGDDFTFEPVEGVPAGVAWDVVLHPFDKDVAYIWGKERTHWISEDKGVSWRSFELEGYPVPFRPPFSFHAVDSNKVLINVCTELFQCEESAYYTTDGFKTPATQLRDNTRSCVFARSSEVFQTSEDDENDQRVICIVKGKYSSPWGSKENSISVSDDFFKTEEEPILESDRMVKGIVNIAVVKGFVVAAASASGTDELALYVTDDAKTWHRAIFPADHKLEQDAYTILESTNYSIQVDVMTTMPVNAMGVLFTSNSNGTYFTRNIEHTNRNFKGMVDFEKIQGIQGIVMVNVVDNWKDVEVSPMAEKKVKTKISFDDGRKFQAVTSEGDDIHLHSVTDMSNVGRVYSTLAPGLAMGIGNKGKYLKAYEEGDLYVSDTAGLSWKKALKGAHKYEFGDRGSVLLAIYDEGPTDSIAYSIDHGKTWKDADLGDEVRARVLTTTPDSTSLKFLLTASQKKGSDIEIYAYSINFEGLHERKCDKSDFEKWYARVDSDNEPTCVMGHKQWYRRRKPDADCFVEKEFEDPQPEYEPCACAKEDFECDYNYEPSDNGEKCQLAGRLPAFRDDQCRTPEDTYKGSSGFRLIPGNACDRKAKGAVNLDEEVERSCQEGFRPPADGQIITTIRPFRASSFTEYYYLERTDRSQDHDETVIMRTDEREVFLTIDAGKTWDQVLKGEKIVSIYPHPYFNDRAFFLTGGKKVFYTINRGKSFGSFEAPALPTSDSLPALTFHPKYKDWLIWTGAVNCAGKGDCHNDAFFTEDRGATWDHKLRYVNKCEFIKEEGGGGLDNLIYCEQYKDELITESLQLKYSDNWFADEKQPFDDILAFATMSEFIVVAARKPDDHNALTCHASVDGKTFADAQFPPTFEVPAQKAYTVLESSSHAIFLHVTVNNRDDYEYGTLIKSNSNGTNYVMSLEGVNRNGKGYVDFEKMLGLEGVILVNQVSNTKEADEGIPKKIKSMITHNDGSQWAPLRAPAKDASGRPFDCDVKDTAKCSLHLHSYTERLDPHATFSSPSAIGLMMGVGNVGEFMGRKAEADTFITRDGGVEWHAVRKGNYMWEYGDQGSIIVIVEREVSVRSVFYTLNEGVDWIEYPFADTDYLISYISTVPSDKSRNFILWGQDSTSAKEIATISLDFSGLTDNKCKLDENNPTDGDYYLWEPKHPASEDNCLLGHVAQYHRKIPDRKCYNGESIQHRHDIARNCSCTRADFEWSVHIPC